MEDLAELRRLGWPSFVETITQVEEHAACVRGLPRGKQHWCSRVTNGTYYVAGVPLRRVSPACPPDASKHWLRRCPARAEVESLLARVANETAAAGLPR